MNEMCDNSAAADLERWRRVLPRVRTDWCSVSASVCEVEIVGIADVECLLIEDIWILVGCCCRLVGVWWWVVNVVSVRMRYLLLVMMCTGRNSRVVERVRVVGTRCVLSVLRYFATADSNLKESSFVENMELR